jgi:hypothetical protein
LCRLCDDVESEDDLTFPFYLSLTRDGAVFTAAIYNRIPRAIAVGSVNVPMDRPFPASRSQATIRIG